MKIRRLSKGDGAIFGRIRLEALITEPNSFGAHASDFDSFSNQDWEGVLSARTAFVAFDGDAPIGLASLFPMDLSRLAHRSEVTNVYVTPGHRGSGVSDALMDTLERFAAKIGVIQLELAVNAENRAAIKFYRKRGYHQIGEVPRGFRHGDRYFDEVLMSKPLDDEPKPA